MRRIIALTLAFTLYIATLAQGAPRLQPEVAGLPPLPAQLSSADGGARGLWQVCQLNPQAAQLTGTDTAAALEGERHGGKVSIIGPMIYGYFSIFIFPPLGPLGGYIGMGPSGYTPEARLVLQNKTFEYEMAFEEAYKKESLRTKRKGYMFGLAGGAITVLVIYVIYATMSAT